jgi:hypothetical protein
MDLTLIEAKRVCPCRDGWAVLPGLVWCRRFGVRLRSLKALKNAFFFFSLRGSGDHKTLEAGSWAAQALMAVDRC